MQNKVSNKNLIIAVVLSAIVLISWSILFPQKNEKSSKSLEKQSGIVINEEVNDVKNTTLGQSVPNVEEGVVSEIIILKNKDIKFTIDTKGLKIENFEILNNKIHSPIIDSSLFLQNGFLSQTNGVPNQDTIWKVIEKSDTLIKFQTIIDDIAFFQSFEIDKNSIVKIKTEVQNGKKTPISFKTFSRVNQKIEKIPVSNIISHEGPIAYTNNQLYEKSYKKIKKSNFSFEGNKKENSWFGVSDKYHLITFIEKGNINIKFSYIDTQDLDTFQTDSLSSVIVVESGQKVENEIKIFAGKKILKNLEKIKKLYKIPDFDKAIDFGSLYFITKPLFKILNFLHHNVNSFAVAIVLLTLIIKLLLMPLTVKSSISMAKMKELAPLIKRLQEQYKNDKHAMGQATVKLYREKNVNPLAGCLPMLIQIPIFFSLYKVLYVSTEMKNQPLFFWIKDLSEPDPTSIVNLFGLLPFNMPPFLGILPILFGISMFLYQLSSPKPADKTQAQIMQFLPVVMTVFLSGFAAGLLFYWIVSNIFSVIQQLIIEKIVLPRHHKKHQKKDKK